MVSSIPSTWLESGRVGPRTSAHILEMRKICCPCQESNHGYSGHSIVNIVTRGIPALEIWGMKKTHNNQNVKYFLINAPQNLNSTTLKIPRSCPLVLLIMVKLTWQWICSTAKWWQYLQTSCPQCHFFHTNRHLTDYKVTTLPMA